ncbi:MAG TPA: SAM-dependent methyltransferase [Thermodesulfobacteriota bacterium]|nr:SAM-dependent methyltransferase [Thermodesulfobacteriota bacterium]
MEEEKRDRGESLRRFILSRIEKGGPIPFSQFMEWCLYHPEFGYYQSKGVTIGKQGDYYTSPSVSPLFGHLIAKQLFQMAEILGGESFDVVEMGGGRGFLCEDILDWAKKSFPAFYQHLRYHLIEPSPLSLKEQRERLREKEREGRVFWIDPKKFVEGTVQIQGCFLSNELIDAFPVHRVILDRGVLKEIYVTHRNGQFEEQCGELSDSRIASYFHSMDNPLEEGHKAEVNLLALEWMERVARCLQRGFVLTIDYGYLADEIYGPGRREGTLHCYFQHQTSENPYERLGEQDITSHVNFTSLIRKGEETGLRFTGLVPQYRFLIGLGILGQIETLGKQLSELDGLKLRLSLKSLIEPEMGMGEVFKVLVQHKGIDQPQLDGLRDLGSIPFPASVEGDRRFR